MFPTSETSRKNTKTLTRTGVVLAGGVLASVVPLSASSAAPAPPRPSPVEVVQAVDPLDAGAPVAVARPGELVAELEGARVVLSHQPGHLAKIETASGHDVEIGLGTVGARSNPDGTAVVHRADELEGSAVVSRASAEGAQLLVVIDEATAPTRYDFDLTVDGVPADLRPRLDGGVEVVDSATGTWVGSVMPPWAVDGADRAVPTAFEVHGSTLTQVVEHAGATYPVVADPNTCGIITCTYYFGKAATRDIANSEPLVGVCGAIAAAVPGPSAVVAAACAVAAAPIWLQAQRADGRGMCLKIKYGRPPAALAFYPDIYRGKHCKCGEGSPRPRPQVGRGRGGSLAMRSDPARAQQEFGGAVKAMRG
ncbi:MAG: hypothetical protein AB7L84_07935, partial [Acidimicrobiia bacterium]